jgi:hypothetical protein
VISTSSSAAIHPIADSRVSSRGGFSLIASSVAWVAIVIALDQDVQLGKQARIPASQIISRMQKS